MPRGGASLRFSRTTQLATLLASLRKSSPTKLAPWFHYDFSPQSPPRPSYAFASLGLERSVVPWRKITQRKRTVTTYKGMGSILITIATHILPINLKNICSFIKLNQIIVFIKLYQSMVFIKLCRLVRVVMYYTSRAQVP